MPEIWMDVDTALSEVPVNKVALIDDTDFKTREESVVYNQAGMDLVWNFVTTAGAYTQTAVTPTTAGVHDWTNQGNGMYSIEIPASGGTISNDTEGFGWFTGFATGILPWTGPIIGFRASGINDKLIDSAYDTTRGLAGTALPAAAAEAAGGLYTRGTGAGQINQDANGRVDTNTAAISQDSTAADNLEADYDGAGYNKSNSTIGTCTTNTDMRGTDSALLASSAPTNFSDLSISTTTGLVDITQTAADKIWGSTTRTVSAATNITSDASAITMSASGVVGTVNLVNTTTTNTDMRGTDNALLASSAPANFSSLVISGAGAVDSLVQGFLNTLLTEATAGRIAGNFDTFFENADAATTSTLDDIISILADTNELQTDDVPGLIAALNDISPAEVNAEVLDVLSVDTFSQPGQGTPAATTTLVTMVAYLYKAWRNRSTQTSSQYSLYNDDATTVDQKATFSDDATTADTGEVGTGP